MTFRFLSPALQEIDEAARYYEGQAVGLGADFVCELDAAIDRILRFPQAWAQLQGGYRFCSLQRFPYSVVYEIEDDQSILILSVFHQHRKPLSWRENL
jgi:plasmid stabilization system protein ParE